MGTGVVEKTVKYYLAGSRIAAVEKNGVLAQIIYDQNGRPFMLRVEDPEATSMVTESHYKYYYYLFNAQNDVIGLVDRDGNKVVSYVYNSWGAPLTTADSSGMDIAGLNPFRYRCYCYDEETAFYYLKSRYYDPWVGRFINADSVIAGIGGSIQGDNMFAYCCNNPVNMSDNSGHWPKCIEKVINWVNDKMVQPAKKFVTDIVEDIKNFDINNQREEKALESNYFSAYKGVPVIRIGGNRSGSFGAIFLTRETNGRNNPEDVVRHEYGHTKQLQQLGIVKYAIDIGIPSVLEIGGGDYYSRVWEITADIYGGVQSRHHAKEDIEAGFSYLELSKCSGPFVWVFMD